MPMPTSIRPMLPLLADQLPAQDAAYAYEYKWDGVRAISYWDGRTLRIESRNLLPIAHRYPELHGIGRSIGRRSAILDGEIIALDGNSRPSFALLQHRMHAEGDSAIAHLARQAPVSYLIFDLLHLGGKELLGLPLADRRKRLEAMKLEREAWKLSPMHIGGGPAMLDAARAQQLEGVVAKRLDSRYEPGRRSPAWLKIKLVGRTEFVVGGWTPQQGSPGRVGSLLVGGHDETGNLRYAGSVGTGYDSAMHERLTRILRGLEQRSSPFAGAVPSVIARFVRPQLVVEVEYRRWPAGGVLQQASFKGIRQDKAAAEVMMERDGKSKSLTDELRGD